MVQQMRRMREDGRPGRDSGGTGHLLAGLAAVRHRLELAPRFQGQRAVALHGGYRLALVRHGGARDRPAHHLAVRRPADVPQDAQAAQGSDRDVRRENAAARKITRKWRSTRKISARVVFRMGERTRGAFTASQVSAGCKNRLSLEIYGTKGSVAWNQERPDELWIGNRNTNNQIIIKDPSLLKSRRQSKQPSSLPLIGCHSILRSRRRQRR